MGMYGRGALWQVTVRPQLIAVSLAVCFLCGGVAAIPTGYAEQSQHGATDAIPRVKAAHTVVSSVPRPPDCQRVACMVLTFDDGPRPDVTPRILDILAQRHIPATFFVIGNQVPGREHIIRRMQQEGHEIGNHSWGHPNFTRITPADLDVQIQQTQVIIVAAGASTPKLLRPPAGEINEMVRTHAGMPLVCWNIDPGDWRSRDPSKITQEIVTHAKPNGIVLLHDIYPSTADALAPAVDVLTSQSQYHFVTLSQLLERVPGDHAPCLHK